MDVIPSLKRRPSVVDAESTLVILAPPPGRGRRAPRESRGMARITPQDQGYLDLEKTGNLRAVQLLLGHTKIESTVRYLEIEVDDALTVAEQIDV